MSHCVFCAIIAGRAESSVVYQDEQVMAFMDIRPWTPGHLLVIPRRHASGLADLDPADGAAVFSAGQRIATTLRSGSMRAEGVNLFLADGVAAGQEVFHVHLHVVPRATGDGFGLRGAPSSPSRIALDQTAGVIRSSLT
ncbi:HIT family hydrolase [Rhodococcus sp. WMMA185]|uniref:HIT family protein n=1 Tax=Rhodococcus sp. WMMA185 TaxID=679318 RepID=UPI000878844D|nr:HIT domain-containing protein [Rhodococcus sp. WMMA185]AOW93441.1 HIT family hydrolase [Rhodococcus sp. WMMA185]